GELWTAGAPVDWDAIAPRVSAHTPLPTYPFQGERYWESGHTRGGERPSGGRRDSRHPLLGAIVRLARGGSLFDARIARDSQPWIADHAILGAPTLPHAALLEIALSAARRVGCDTVRELTVEAPLRLDGEGSELQVSLTDPDATEARTIDIHSRPYAAEGAAEGGQRPHTADGAVDGGQRPWTGEERPWTRHATGTLAAAPRAESPAPAPGDSAEAWPPPGAQEIDLDGVYERLARNGEECGPRMQSLRAAWHEEGIVFADVALADSGEEPFTIHPALLAGMFHAATLDADADDAAIAWPVSWRGVTVHKAGATQLRIRIARDASDSVSILATDEAGEIVASVEALEIRPRPAGEIVDVARALLALEWRPPAYTSEERAADVFVVDLGGVVCVDVDEHEVRRAAAAGETLLALRGGRARVPRLIYVGDVHDETEASRVLATIDPRRTVLIHAESALEAARLAAQLVSHDGAERMVLATPIDQRALRDAEQAGSLPPLLRDLVRRPNRTVAHSAGRSLLRRLQRVAPDERAPLVLEAVREAIAEILRYGSGQDVDPRRALRDLGFDSVSALELRNRLVAMSGVALPLSTVIDHPTPQALAEHLDAQLAESGQDGERLAVHAEASATTDRVVELAGGGNTPILLCVPSVLAMSGPHEYVGLARAVEGAHDVCALHLPGFQPRSRPPETMEEAIAAIARTTIEHTAGSPFVLLGHSSGGLIAHALAARLQSLDHASQGVVLIDSYSTRGTSPATLSRAMAEILGASEAALSASEERLTAMNAYLELLRSWREEPIDAPVLLLRATEPMKGLDATEDWRASWPLQHTAVDVPGDHLTMMSAHIASTVAAIREWLSHTTRTRGAELEHAVD
ncbi:MAG TPA: alpha/beta fold hydrolase, partial [Solirubrobacteraceae bacterium]|nr:alpha/beta fold hydrolase [Solirubrobacteraceae bacterium]